MGEDVPAVDEDAGAGGAGTGSDGLVVQPVTRTASPVTCHGACSPGERFDGQPVRQGRIELCEDDGDHVVQVGADPGGAEQPCRGLTEPVAVRAGEVLEDLAGLCPSEEVLPGVGQEVVDVSSGREEGPGEEVVEVGLVEEPDVFLVAHQYPCDFKASTSSSA